MGTERKVNAPRVVLDTNVVVSALLFASGRLRWLRHAWLQGKIIPVVNQQTTLELLRVLTYPKFRLSPDEQEDLLAEYLPYCEVAAVHKRAPALPIRDPADQVFLQLALTARVGYVVTGDADLLSLEPPSAVMIVTPEQLRLQMGGKR